MLSGAWGCLIFMSLSFKFHEHTKQARLADFAATSGEKEVTLTPGIPPSVLRINKEIKVYGEQLHEFSDGKREKDIYIQGIANHPHVTLVDNPTEADYVLWVTVQNIGQDQPWIDNKQNGWNSPLYKGMIDKKMIVLDFADTPDDHGLLRDKIYDR
jgi:hypothetical protein